MRLIRRAFGEHAFGETVITRMGGEHADMLMDFSVLRMHKGDVHRDTTNLERAYLLVTGEVELLWGEEKRAVRRGDCFYDSPVALHVPGGVEVEVVALKEDCEINILRTDNENAFPAKLYMPSDTLDEHRGAGLMRETSTRIVRTIFDKRKAPDANLVLGEVIGFPGKWSSYPPHHHPQPEIYYYKTLPKQGFGYAELGEDVFKVRNNDATFIAPGLTHPHVTAPGYALWYLWAIRHLDGNPYDTPTFLPEHLWVQEEGAHYFPDEEVRS